MTELDFTEGFIPFEAGETYFKIFGDLDSTRIPLVVAHGGPGFSHDYVLDIADISLNGRPVIFYDQIGGGRSTHLADREDQYWTVELFLRELETVLGHFGISREYFLLGQSWGGMLAAEHAILRPDGLRGLIISNSPASMELWASEASRLRQQLPLEVQEQLNRHEMTGDYFNPEYLAATARYYDEHVIRVHPMPDHVQRSFAFVEADNTVYMTMNGPNEFECIGTLRGWSVVNRLDSIAAPTMLISGRHDEATPECVRPFFEGIDGAIWEIFEDSSHMPFVEEKDHFIATVQEFLNRIDP